MHFMKIRKNHLISKWHLWVYNSFITLLAQILTEVLTTAVYIALLHIQRSCTDRKIVYFSINTTISPKSYFSVELQVLNKFMYFYNEEN